MEKLETIKIDIADVIKGVVFSTVISLLLVLVFALIIRYCDIENKVIIPVNVAIKIFSVFLGVILSFRNMQNGLFKGALTGLFYMLLTFLIFASLNSFQNVKFSWIDMITLTGAGAISGVLTVNLRRITPKKQKADKKFKFSFFKKNKDKSK